MASNSFNSLPRIVVPFTFLTTNADNPGLKDFTPVIVPADTPDPELEPEIKTLVNKHSEEEEAGDGDDPKVFSSAPDSAASSLNPSVADVPLESEEDHVPVEKVNSPTQKLTTPGMETLPTIQIKA